MSSLRLQLQESEYVLSELEMCGKEDTIFKAVGCVLFSSSKEEAVSNVKRRIGFMTKELENNKDKK